MVVVVWEVVDSLTVVLLVVNIVVDGSDTVLGWLVAGAVCEVVVVNKVETDVVAERSVVDCCVVDWPVEDAIIGTMDIIVVCFVAEAADDDAAVDSVCVPLECSGTNVDFEGGEDESKSVVVLY